MNLLNTEIELACYNVSCENYNKPVKICLFNVFTRINNWTEYDLEKINHTVYITKKPINFVAAPRVFCSKCLQEVAIMIKDKNDNTN